MRVFLRSAHLSVVPPVAYLLCTMLLQDPAILQVRVVEGEGAAYAIGSRATRGLAVLVTDETGKPVDGATISFRLPEEGPSGAFATGSKTEIAATRGDGRAGVWGMQWNHTVGSFEIRITAVKGQTRAGTVCSQFLTEAHEGSKAQMGPSRSHKWLWIAIAVGGAAAGGVAATALGGKPGATPTSSPAGVQIGAPTISLGHK